MKCNCPNYNHPNHENKPCENLGDSEFGGLCIQCKIQTPTINEKGNLDF